MRVQVYTRFHVTLEGPERWMASNRESRNFIVASVYGDSESPHVTLRGPGIGTNGGTLSIHREKMILRADLPAPVQDAIARALVAA